MASLLPADSRTIVANGSARRGRSRSSSVVSRLVKNAWFASRLLLSSEHV